MSHRAKWAHWKRITRQDSAITRIPAGLAFLGLGCLLVFAAWEGMRDHRFMFLTFDFRPGHPVIGQTIGLLVMGAVFVVAGIAALLDL
jgi:hypothetical protein